MKFGKYANTYAMASQGIISMAVLGVIGFFIGRWIDKHSVWPAILAIVGVLFGLFTLVGNLIYILKQEEKEKQKQLNKEESNEKDIKQ